MYVHRNINIIKSLLYITPINMSIVELHIGRMNSTKYYVQETSIHDTMINPT